MARVRLRMFSKKTFMRDLLIMFFGAILFAIAYNWFLVPWKMAPGGVGGLASILYHYFNLPLGIMMILFNIPLFICAYIFLSPSFALKSLYGILITNITTIFLEFEVLQKYGIIHDMKPFTQYLPDGTFVYALLPHSDMMLTCIVGNVLLGISLGLIFRSRGSTGGTDIPVAILKQKFGLSIGNGYWIVESIIILIVAVAFQDIKVFFWAYVSLFICTKVTDIACEGIPYLKGVYIISKKHREITRMIYKEVDRGVTYIKAEGSYTGDSYNMIFCVMNRLQVPLAREVIKRIDKNAFVVVTDVNDVMGFGFKSRALDLTGDSLEKENSATDA